MGTDGAGEEDAGMSQSDVIAWLQEHPGWQGIRPDESAVDHPDQGARRLPPGAMR